MDTGMREATARAVQQAADIDGPCPVGQRPDPCAVVIFGASGDLTARKLMPALYCLKANDILPEDITVTGAARSDMSDEDFRRRMGEAVAERDDFDAQAWERLRPRLFYQRLEYGEAQGYRELAAQLEQRDAAYGTRGNRIFYFATPPSVYAEAARMLHAAGLSREPDGGFSRLVVEKPFGHDLTTAQALDATLHEGFDERQIFRIDHYLAKETVQNILMFRFANAIFEPIWNRRYIEYVTCASAESIGVEHRAGYYERSGVLRDMFQNHMMQLLALVAMEPPSIFEADRVRDEKAKVYRSLRPFAAGRLREDLVLGQYSPGERKGTPLSGYRQEPGVSPDSVTPTFAMMRAWVDNWRWQGVPFQIMSGKRLREKITRIVVQFREAPHSMFRALLGEHIAANRLVLDIHPDNAVSLTFQSKAPGAQVCLAPVTMRFDFPTAGGGFLGAYEKVLLDCMLGDQMLFWRQDGVELCWGFLTPILELCEDCGDVAEHLHPYAAGTWGPARSLDLVRTLF